MIVGPIGYETFIAVLAHKGLMTKEEARMFCAYLGPRMIPRGFEQAYTQAGEALEFAKEDK